MSIPTSAASPGMPAPARRQVYVRAVGPRLRKLLYVVFVLFALLGANSVYLVGVTFLEWTSRVWGEGLAYQSPFSLFMVLAHIGLGFLLIAPVVVFGIVHMLASWKRRNRRAVYIGYVLFALALTLLATGVLLVRVKEVFDLNDPFWRGLVYWLHVACPVVLILFYCLHRLAGPRIKWRIGAQLSLAVVVVVGLLMLLHSQDPDQWDRQTSEQGEKYFQPSQALTETGAFINPDALMMNEYCQKCHSDIYDGWFHSVHHFSSFNNDPYLAAIMETREVVEKRDGTVQASRWCAGCHDPVPFFSGAFDNPKYDILKDKTAHAGITCTTCHGIVQINVHGPAIGNADYVIEQSPHYPFAFSKNPILQYINNQLIKAKPAFHKQTFLKPFHKTAEFCSTCHKVHLPKELNHYRDFLRGQDHYTTYLLSGASGHGARSFYYPDVAKTKCAECHMPLLASDDFGRQMFEEEGGKELSIHSHFFPAANTGAVGYLRDRPEVVKAHQEFLKEVVRVDIFGVREGGRIDGDLHGPLGQGSTPTLQPGERYLLETVIRTLKLGHPFTQGTVDSNEVWMGVTVTSGGKVIGRSGALDENGEVDPWSHFVNVFLLDRNGNRIDRRNPQDIFVPLYNHQVPPGAAQVVHYALDVPEDAAAPITVEVKLQYRKFDYQYMKYVAATLEKKDKPLRGHTPGKPYVNALPITTLATAAITFPVSGSKAKVTNPKSAIPPWQRWNDYGIGLFLEGQAGAKAELRQAAHAFAKVEELGRYDGPLNLARVYEAEGLLTEAVDALNRAAKADDPPAPAWTLAWFTGRVNRQEGHLEDAVKNFRSILEDRTQEMVDRRFDFSKDFVVINELAATYFDLSKRRLSAGEEDAQRELLEISAGYYRRTLEIDSEDVAAHHGLQLVYSALGDEEKAAAHARLHERYKLDDNARDVAVAAARKKYPAANHAAEALVIYPLHREGAPGLAAEAAPQGAIPETVGVAP